MYEFGLTLFSFTRCSFDFLRFVLALLMIWGKNKNFSVYTQFVPLFAYATFICQFFVADMLAPEVMGYKNIFILYETWQDLILVHFIFTSLATNHHYLWNAFFSSPFLIFIVYYIRIQQEKIIIDEASDRDLINTGVRTFVTFCIAAVVTLVSYYHQLVISNMIVDKHMLAK